LDEFRDEIIHKQIEVSLDGNVSSPFYSYPALIKIIFQNLLENAISFCTPLHPTLKIKMLTLEDSVQIVFDDNGEGIESIYLPRIFEMYFRANEKSKGNGLGLYIVKKNSG
jgi:signal transduction histidine kinase